MGPLVLLPSVHLGLSGGFIFTGEVSGWAAYKFDALLQPLQFHALITLSFTSSLLNCRGLPAGMGLQSVIQCPLAFPPLAAASLLPPAPAHRRSTPASATSLRPAESTVSRRGRLDVLVA